MIIDSTSIQRPAPGSPTANSPKRNTQAKMLISITFLMPKRCRKNGIARMKSVSEICEIDSSRFGCSTPKVPGYAVLKSSRNAPPKAFVICSAAPSIIAKMKNTSICRRRNSTKASSPSAETRLRLPSDFAGGHFGIVNA